MFLRTKGLCESSGHASEEAIRSLFLRNPFTTPWSSSSVASCSFVNLFTHQTVYLTISLFLHDRNAQGGEYHFFKKNFGADLQR